MRLTIFARALVLAILAAGLVACSEGKGPFRMVQFCLASADEIPAFTAFMNEIAQENRMEFFDRSSQTHDELRSLASDNKNVPFNGRTLNIGADQGSDFSFAAGNLGLPTRQVVVGFNGDNLKYSKTFSNSVVERLSRRWRIHEVPKGRGAFPLSHCD